MNSMIEIFFNLLSNSLLEHIISCVASLVRNCSGANRQRVLNKFTESDHEKVRKLFMMNVSSNLFDLGRSPNGTSFSIFRTCSSGKKQS